MHALLAGYECVPGGHRRAFWKAVRAENEGTRSERKGVFLMNADRVDSAGTADIERKGSVTFSGQRAAMEVFVDDQADYPKLTDSRLSQHELKRARSAVDVAVPWLVWPVFVISNIVGASSAAVIVSMEGAAPLSLAGWRHQVSALAMLPFFVFEWRKLAKFDRSKALTTHSLGLLFCSSLAISAHFACYLWSLKRTSMTHCLFLTSMSPILVAIHTRLTGRVLMTGEIIGVSLGLVGVAVLASGTDVEKGSQSTHTGDAVALLASGAMAAYLIIGRKLRGWMPLFVYQFPVAVLAFMILGTMGLLFEGWNSSDVGEISGLFGWLRKENILGTIYLGIGPGIVGHAGYSFVLRYASPLVMPAGFSLQPIIGSSLGWVVGESPAPGLWTCLGGAVTLAGTLFVSCGSAKRKAQVESEEEEYKQSATDDEEAQQGTKPLLQPSEP